MGQPPEIESESGSAPSVGSRARRQGEIRVRAQGLPRGIWPDIYHTLIRLTWPRLSLLFAAVFLGFNLLFALLYQFDPNGLADHADNSGVPRLARDFFFSVHTVATVGYGNIYPVSLYANVLVVIEITFGLVLFALATGIAFARFSRPTARILFSRVLVVRDVDGTPTLMLRAANQRHNMIYSASVRLALLDDVNVGGTMMRRFLDLKLVRDSNPTFALTWTVMHPIEQDSPIHRWLADHDLAGSQELVVLVSGFDEISGQTIHGRWVYSMRDIRWGARFVDIVTAEPDGTRTIDYHRFHEVVQGEEG